MAKTKISEYDATAANNTDVDSVNIAEGCAPSGINNAIREVMSHLKDFQTGAAGDDLTVGGTLTSGTVDINGGAIDGTTIGATTTAAGSFTNLTATGTTTLAGASTSADITFGDSDKAIFGAGSDLQIYHSGAHSYINESGTGNLRILAENFTVRNPADNESMIIATPDGGVTLFYDSASKLATTSTGIDVTGTVVADGLTVDGVGQIELNDTTVYSGSTASVGQLSLKNFDTTTAYTPAVLDFTARGTTTTSSVWQMGNAGLNSAYAESDFFIKNRTAASTYAQRFLIEGNGDISFYEDTGTTPKFFWDASAESLGIGTDSPNAKIEIENGAEGLYFTAGGDDVANGRALRFTSSTSSTGSNGALHTIKANSTAGEIAFANGNGNIMYLNSSGNVGIGTDSPANILDISKSSTGNTVVSLKNSNAGTSAAAYYSVSNGTSGTNMVQLGTGYTTLGVFQANSGGLWATGVNGGFIAASNAAGTLRFATGGYSEKMRIDSSGNLLVGRTDTSGVNNTSGAYIYNEGAFVAQRNSNASLFLNRYGTDGEIALFRKDGTTVGSIGANNSNAYISGSTRGLHFTGVAGIIPCNEAGAARDADTNLGTSSTRFKDLYLSGGVYVGGTGSANKLDDYEEGTWTATLAGATTNPTTPVTSVARYIKIGKSVTVSFTFTGVNTTGASGFVQVTGLPFTVNSNAQARAHGAVMSGYFPLSTGYAFLVARAETGASNIKIIQCGDAVAPAEAVHSAGSLRYMASTITYETT